MTLVVSARARRDLLLLLSVSRTQFGLDAQHRYRRLIEQAIEDIGADPGRAGVKRLDGADGVLLYHSRHAQTSTPRDQRVGHPRHVLAFRLAGGQIEILRILHDAMDLPSRLAEL